MPVGYFYGQAWFFDDVFHALPHDMAIRVVGDHYLKSEFGKEGFPQGEELVEE